MADSNWVADVSSGGTFLALCGRRQNTTGLPGDEWARRQHGEGMEVVKAGHSGYHLQYPVVWVCKYRRRMLNPSGCQYMRKVLPKLLRSMPGVVIEMIGIDRDHVHRGIVIPPRYSVAAVMGQLKSQWSSHLRKTFGWLRKVYWKENIVWSPGYSVSSVGVEEETVKRYVEHQGRQDSGQFRMEL